MGRDPDRDESNQTSPDWDWFRHLGLLHFEICNGGVNRCQMHGLEVKVVPSESQD